MTYNSDEEFSQKLKLEDELLLSKIDKLNSDDSHNARCAYYSKLHNDFRAIQKLKSLPVGVESIRDLLDKYDFYNPYYEKSTHIFYFRSALPVKVFELFRYETKKFKFNDIIVMTPTNREGYEKWKKINKKVI